MILGDRITKGLIVVKYGHTQPLSRIRTIEAGHPEPDENGMAGANAVMAMAGDADDTTLVITLISGGGSALLPLPMRFDADGNQLDMESYVPGRSDEDDAVPFLTLSHKQAVTRELLRCGRISRRSTASVNTSPVSRGAACPPNCASVQPESHPFRCGGR